MRKYLFALIVLVGVALCACASATSFTFQDIAATCDVPDSYIILTPDNLDQHEEWVAGQGTTKDALSAAWKESGVLVQAWTSEGDACIEISAVQDAEAKQYFDLDQQSTKVRSAYRNEFLKGSVYKALGYTYQTAEWKKTSQYGRFLMLKYKRTADGKTYRGLARKTIRNGYTITIDYRVYDRTVKTADNTALNKLMATWAFSQIKDKPAEAAAQAVFSSVPPAETNTGAFTVAGTCEAGLKIVGVIMRMFLEPTRVETVAGKTGKFSMDVQLPEEGVWLMTVTVENGDAVVQEQVFDTTTYQKSLLPVNFDEEVPTELSADTLTIAGTTARGVSVQCLVGDTFDRQIRTNGTGRFSFKIDTSAEATYNITIIFQKKGYDTRRFTYTASRALTEEDIHAQIREQAVKPAYSTLTKKLEGYTGRIMGYSLYVVNMAQAGDEWIITMAMNQSKSSGYRDIVVVKTKEEPNFSLDSQQKMYGTCVGSYDIQNSDGSTDTYPCFDLLFWDT